MIFVLFLYLFELFPCCYLPCMDSLLLSEDIEINPGPFKILHWSVNSMTNENYKRKTLIEAPMHLSSNIVLVGSKRQKVKV